MKNKSNTYKSSGVDIEKSNRIVRKIEKISSKNIRKEIINNAGGFASILDLKKLNYKDPLLLSSTDGVGTKLKLAVECDSYEYLGFDLVGMCVNDLLAEGGEPLIFLDYFSSSEIIEKNFIKIIKSINLACSESNCSLVGGETAEMPGIYKINDFDIAGFSVGVVERKNLADKKKVKNNDIIIGLRSNGFHSNGYSLIRKIISNKKIRLDKKPPYESKELTLGKDLLRPTKIYIKSILPLIKKGLISSMAHITGGGIIENIQRSIPSDMCAEIKSENFESDDCFKWISKIGDISASEMMKTFNCGIGFIVIINKKNETAVKKFFNKNKIDFFYLGNIKKRNIHKVNIKKLNPWF
tara:strand:- start:530 stop:1591 length:1062 start_codon:yes stop_codon:yes gene_type:complete